MKERSLYPMKFEPIYKTKIWGGEKLKTILNKTDAPENAGESWEISAVQDNISVLANGFLKGNNLQELIEIYMGDLLGPQVYDKFGNEFPLLIKFIDANDNLSVQVHPGDETARKRHNAYGKTEMWYVIQADPGSELISGFNQEISKEEFVARLNDNRIVEVLNFTEVKAGDVFFIPAGRIHATGKGILFAEIQQTSDITYRVYDWDRKDKQGKGRELHTELARDVIDYSPVDKARTDYRDEMDKPVRIISSEHFVSNYIHLETNMTKSYVSCNSFVVLICVKGKLKLKWEHGSISMEKGETVLLPYELMEVSFVPESESILLETYIDMPDESGTGSDKAE
ncbi:MAG: type I phosphomannose isomerase catalytic subunit [Bacteroidales bacterium]